MQMKSLTTLLEFHTGSMDVSIIQGQPPLVRTYAVAPFFSMFDDYDWGLYSNKVGDGQSSKWTSTVANARIVCVFAYLPESLYSYFAFMFSIWVLWKWLFRRDFSAIRINCVAFWCFCPTTIAFASTINPDLGAVTFGLVAGIRCLAIPRVAKLLIGDACWSFSWMSLLTKLTWI